MKDITLVIMAAGMGSRFGGLKQIEPFGPNEEFIIDYSVFDAVKVGFTKVVFIIKRENFEVFKETIGKRVEPYVKVRYVFQEGYIPDGVEVSKTRVKPLGTGHAILCCRDIVKEPFAVINADDFYGRDAYVKAYDFLKKLDVSDNKYGVVGYEVGKTVTDNGAVKRGVCSVKDGRLLKITESSISKDGTSYVAAPLDGSSSFEVQADTIVSMNFLLFTPTLFDHLERLFKEFFIDMKDKDKDEYLIPDVIEKLIMEGAVDVSIMNTTANWYGVTYKADAPIVRKALKEMVDMGIYDSPLWEEKKEQSGN